MDTDIDPVEVGSRSGLLWRHSDLVLAGVGEALRIPFKRPDGAKAATETLARLKAESVGDESARDGSELNRPGVGPVAFTALPFERTETGELIVPELLLGQDSTGRRWLTSVADRPFDIGAARSRLEACAAARPAASESARSFKVVSTLTPEKWRDELVGAARNAIVAGELTKAVISRRLTLTCDQRISIGEVVGNLIERFPTAVVFNIEGFVGASPELLVSRTQDMVHAHPLAGTAARASDPAADSHQIAHLLASKKDRWEHKITIDWLLDTLLPFCSYVDAEPEPSVVTLANVHHLGTLVEGRLSTPQPSVLEMVSALHPTPAVGGHPQQDALALIGKLEGESRGRYAGPTGWLDGDGNGAFVVAIRSAEIAENRAEFRAGVGVVANSDPAAELLETRNKFQAMLGALIRP